MKSAILIPIYEPTEKVLPFLKTFSPDDFDEFLVVDDGSGEAYSSIFKQIEEETPFKVLSYPVNGGKGVALKRGFAKLLQDSPDLEGIVPADGDGQHTLEDIRHIRDGMKEYPDALILGVRTFENAPKRSQFGNEWSSNFFRSLTGKKLGDTQTGLRGIPSALFDYAVTGTGNRYEYEMYFLLDAAREFPIHQIPIQTIYENNNEGSHFRPFRDSMRVMRPMFLYLLFAVIATIVDLTLFGLSYSYLFTEGGVTALFFAMLEARLISGVFLFFVLDFVVFHARGSLGFHALKYIALSLLSLGISFGLCAIFPSLPLAGLIAIKAGIDFLLGFGKYFLNSSFVFSSWGEKKKKKRQ